MFPSSLTDLWALNTLIYWDSQICLLAFRSLARLQRFPRRRKEVETNPDMVKSKQDRCENRNGNKYVTNKTRIVVEPQYWVKAADEA